MEYNAKSSELNVFQRIASGDEKTVMAAISLLREYGMPAPTTRKDLAKGLTVLVATHGDSAASSLAKIHPDADFIAANIVVEPVSQHKNDCGCHKNDTGAQVTATADASKSLPPLQTNFDINHFAFLTIMTVGAFSFLMMIAGNIAFRKHD